jgi:hypothetical protein
MPINSYSLWDMKQSSAIDSLLAEELELERRLKEVQEKRAALQKKKRTPRATSSLRPLRDIVVEGLTLAKCPLNSLLLASVIRPWQGRDVPSTRFGTLSTDEIKSYDSSRARPVYLCHCVTFDRGEAVKRFWARSDWPLADRIMAPMTGRILFLKGASWAIRMAKAVAEERLVASDPDILNYVAADQARDAGITVKRGEFPFAEWLTAIDAAIGRFEPEDRSIRDAAAATLSERLPERALLFGAPAGFVSLPGSHREWRSARDDG